MLLELLPLLIIGVYAAFAVAEAVRPGRAFPRVARWRIKGAFFLLLGLALTGVLPPLWESWLGNYRLIDATGLGTWGGALFGFVVLELGVYIWHRSLHRFQFLWRGLHQMHHSAERVDIWGAMYFHPLDLTAFAFVYSLMLVVVAGVSAEAALIANLTASFYGFFQHANINTPSWLGYIIQRPEQHSLHHERGVHGYNYSDLPLWDLLFGTFRNPARWEAQAGFYDGASARVPEMLIGLDVSTPRQALPGDATARPSVAT
ncbi:MAG TPA: sterol desaturase family protein [Polyangiales bacterium]|nr:sterol desaturase family protein [Polyangiales bacterium]